MISVTDLHKSFGKPAEKLPRSTTWTKAPRQMVIRKAMIRVGTARRSAGSAVNSL